MIEELPPIPERGALPSMFTLYTRDLHYCTEKHIDLPVRMACSVCVHLPKLWPYVMDFIQEGNEELLRCRSVFNEQGGGNDTNFRKYAAKCIRGVIYHYFSRIPSIYVHSETRSSLLRKGRGREIEHLEHAESWEALRAAIGETIANPTNMQLAFCAAKRKQIDALLRQLTAKERQVIIWFYGLDDVRYDYEEIAQKLGIKVRQVQNLRKNAEDQMNGRTAKPARELVVARQAQERRNRLQRVYDAHHGKIGIMRLAKLAKCGQTSAAQFLHEQKRC